MKYNLSEITDLIRSRRSITPEQFSDRKVHRDQLELILNNAIWAPTHGKTEPWRFKVFTGGSLPRLGSWMQEMYRSKTSPDKFNQSKYDRFAVRCSRVSVIIAVCMKRDQSGKIAEIEEIEAVACAVQNMSLTCTAYGLAAFWSTPGFIYSPEARTFLGLEEQDKCLGLVYIGYPEGPWPSAHRKPLEYVTEWMDE